MLQWQRLQQMHGVGAWCSIDSSLLETHRSFTAATSTTCKWKVSTLKHAHLRHGETVAAGGAPLPWHALARRPAAGQLQGSTATHAGNKEAHAELLIW